MDFAGIDWTLVFGVAFGISEALALIPQVRANSLFQVVYNILKTMLKR